MLAEVKQKMKFVGTKTVQTKNGNTLEFVVVGDPVNYEKFEFFKTNELYIDGLKQDDDVYILLEVTRNGFTTNTDLQQIRKVG